MSAFNGFLFEILTFCLYLLFWFSLPINGILHALSLAPLCSPILQAIQTYDQNQINRKGVKKCSKTFIPAHNIKILCTFNSSFVSTEIANWLKSMQNPWKLKRNEFTLNKTAKFLSELLHGYVSQILSTFPEYLFSTNFRMFAPVHTFL